ncbi:MAG: indole-3-glycerol phosphate synthase TrpC [Acidimicrobiia bacterium]
MTVLDDILAGKRDEVTMLHRPAVRDLLRKEALAAPPTRDFAAALRPAGGTIGVIAEIKRRSPSKGDLAPDLDPAATAKAYAAGGAACLSVLTDGPWFGGAVADLEAARGACDLPVLRKDFTVDEVQVYETRAIGADAILLIVAALPDDAHLADLHALATDLGLAVLVETHDDAELERALACGARIVGVNARNLGTFDEDLSVGERLAARLPVDVIAVAESAIRSVEDAERMAAAGFDTVLVGEMLVKSDDATEAVRGLASVTRRGR